MSFNQKTESAFFSLNVDTNYEDDIPRESITEDKTIRFKAPNKADCLRFKYKADMNSATFFAMTFEYKWKYKYSDQDLSDLFKECTMIMTI